MFIELDTFGYCLREAPAASGPSARIAPHTAIDGTKPDGMRKPRWAGVWDAAAEAWNGGSWIDEEAAQLSAALEAQNLYRIDAEAGRVITARLPEWKQRNMLALKSELQDKRLDGVTFTAAEQADWDALITEWAWVKAVRATSDTAKINNTPVDKILWPTM